MEKAKELSESEPSKKSNKFTNNYGAGTQIHVESGTGLSIARNKSLGTLFACYKLLQVADFAGYPQASRDEAARLRTKRGT